MTVCCLYIDKDRLMCLADSRITGDERQILTDNVSKIMILPVVVTRWGKSVRPVPSFQLRFGFTYAGSSLLAFSAYAAVSSACQTLASTNPQSPPSLEDVGKFLLFAVTKLSNEIRNAHNNKGGFGRGEIVIFGRCPVLKRFSAYAVLVQENPKDNFVENIQLEGRIAYIGQSEELSKRVSSGLHAWDAMVSVIDDPSVLNIGGRLQCCEVDLKGNVSLTPVLTPLDDDPDQASLSVAGFELDAQGAIGETAIGYMARAARPKSVPATS
jgi:hypothetical protein